MKRLILTLAFLQALSMFGQKKLDGTYCSKRRYSGQMCFTFKSDSLFDYNTNSCKSTGKGRGIYKITQDTLKLIFFETDTAKNSAIIEKIDCENIDSFALNLHVTELETKLPISYADVWFSKNERTSKYYKPDSDGNLIIKLSTSKIPPEFNLNIKIAMHKQMTFKVNTSFCSNIKYSKPLRCGYSPYSNTWEDWSINPLTHYAVSLYQMESIINNL